MDPVLGKTRLLPFLQKATYRPWASYEQKGNVSLAVLTYPDGSYGNLPDARAIADACHEYITCPCCSTGLTR